MAETRDDETAKPIQPEAAPDATPSEAVETDAGRLPEHDPREASSLTAPEHDPREEAPALVAPVHDPAGDAPTEVLIEEELADPDEESPMAAGDDALPQDPPAPASQPEAPRRNTFLPAVLGGVVAAGLGFGAAMIAFPPVDGTALEQAQAEQAARLDDLAAQLEAGPDLSSLDDLGGSLSTLQGTVEALDGRLSDMSETLSALSARVDELEKQPLAESVSDEAIAAYEQELAGLQQAMQDQRAEIEQMVADSQSLRADAAATARDTQVRAALVRLNGSLSDGSSFEAPLKTLSELGLDIPATLEERAAAGIPTLARLRNDFPDAARDALAATRDGSLGGSFGDFLKNQLGARSLTPKEGDDPDAILSRAEAGLNDGDLAQVLVELDGLPEPALVAMDDWLALARTRAETLDAAEALSAQTK
ncbi:COG4223 family protein [Oceanicola sp. S124]|uniref:COG4223 family protein n=1 Tax=Oceanicola sp. S124 TaxID=1042378 RepID=UPI00025596C2|nr:hypothetical protein [Oceanicola sp. S124]